MFVLFLVVALIAGAVLLGLNAHERVEGLLLHDRTGAVVLEGWDILIQHSVIVGILATVAFLLALAIGFSVSELHIRLALRIRREWLDRKYRDDQLGVARDENRRLQRQLEDAQRQLVAVKCQHAEFRRKLRRVTRERDRALKAGAKASASPDPARPSSDPRPRRPPRGHSAPRARTALVHSVSTEVPTETAPHNRLFSENVGRTSNEAALRAAWGRDPPPR